MYTRNRCPVLHEFCAYCIVCSCICKNKKVRTLGVILRQHLLALLSERHYIAPTSAYLVVSKILFQFTIIFRFLDFWICSSGPETSGFSTRRQSGSSQQHWKPRPTTPPLRNHPRECDRSPFLLRCVISFLIFMTFQSFVGSVGMYFEVDFSCALIVISLLDCRRLVACRKENI